MLIDPKKILIIQTAFIGDTILASSVAEELHFSFPKAKIVLLVKKGNESIFENHPFLEIWTHDKSHKYKSLFTLIKKIRQEKFDVVINLHRYLSSNLMSVFSGAKYIAGFQSFLSNFFHHSVKHQFKKGLHEIHRYHQLVEPITHQKNVFYPKLYFENHIPNDFDFNKKYVCLFPASIWATKQMPPLKWVELIQRFSKDVTIYLCGAKNDFQLCEFIKNKSNRDNCFNIAGKYSILQIASIVKHAQRTYVNDSSPLHIASSVNAPVTAFFCSTVTDFGFYPLSEDSEAIEVKNLDCRPCGIHGHKECPKKHFKCGLELDISKVKVV